MCVWLIIIIWYVGIADVTASYGNLSELYVFEWEFLKYYYIRHDKKTQKDAQVFIQTHKDAPKIPQVFIKTQNDSKETQRRPRVTPGRLLAISCSGPTIMGYPQLYNNFIFAYFEITFQQTAINWAIYILLFIV